VSDSRLRQGEAGFQSREARPRQTPLASASEDAVPTPPNCVVEAVKPLPVAREAIVRVVAPQRADLSLPLTPSAASPLKVRPVSWDDGGHAHPHPHRPPPRGPIASRPGARNPRLAPSAGRAPTLRAASTPAMLGPAVLGPACPDCGAAGRMPSPWSNPRPSSAGSGSPSGSSGPGRAAGTGQAARTSPQRSERSSDECVVPTPLGRAADPRGTAETGRRDLTGDGVQIHGSPSKATVPDLAHFLDNHLRSLVCCEITSPTTTVTEPTSHWRRTHRSRDRWSVPTTAESSRCPWSEACIIGTHGWLPRDRHRPLCCPTTRTWPVLRVRPAAVGPLLSL
jgi:hypothetical protein